MTEITSNHGWEIPEVGGSKDVWGQILNDFFDGELDEEVALKGPFSERPIAGGDVSDLYLATDRRIVYYNDGTSWEAVYGLGTEEELVPGTSHFESVHTEREQITDHTVIDATLSTEQYTTAGAFETVEYQANRDNRGEWNDTTHQFTPSESAEYVIIGGITLREGATGDTIRLRLNDDTNTSAVIEDWDVRDTSGLGNRQTYKVALAEELTESVDYSLQFQNRDSSDRITDVNLRTYLRIRQKSEVVA